MKLCTLFILPEELPSHDPGEVIDTSTWHCCGPSWVRDDHEFGLSKDRRHFHLEGVIQKVEVVE